jgi:hypothetical protein
MKTISSLYISPKLKLWIPLFRPKLIESFNIKSRYLRNGLDIKAFGYQVVLHKVVMTLKNLLGFKNLAGLPLLYAGLPAIIF